MTRKEFLSTPWKMHPWDGLYINPNADPKCETCKGHGIVDTGLISCVLENCPDCWKEKDDQ